MISLPLAVVTVGDDGSLSGLEEFCAQRGWRPGTQLLCFQDPLQMGVTVIPAAEASRWLDRFRGALDDSE